MKEGVKEDIALSIDQSLICLLSVFLSYSDSLLFSLHLYYTYVLHKLITIKFDVNFEFINSTPIQLRMFSSN